MQDEMEEDLSKIVQSMKKMAAKPFFSLQKDFLWVQGRIVLWVAFLDGLQIALFSDDRHTVHVHIGWMLNIEY